MSFGQGFGGIFGRPDDRSGGSDDSGGSSRGFGFSSGSGGSGDGDRPRSEGVGSRRPGALLLTLIILGVLVALFVLFVMVYTEVLWFNQLGFQQVFWTEQLTKAILFVIAGVVMAAVTWLALHLAYKYRPKNLAGQLRRNVEQYQKQLEPIRRLVFIGAPILIGFFAGTAAMNGWEQVLLFFNQVPYGMEDPQFGMDLTFYMASLPMMSTIISFLTSVVLVAGIAGIIVHYLYGGIRIEEGSGVTVERAARLHILIFASVYMLLQGARYWLNRYETLQDQSGNWAGAMYTDVNAVIPTSAILAIAAIIVIGLFIATMINGRWRLSIIGVAGFLVAALIAGAIYPFLIQEYRVAPTEQTMEAEFIERNIDFTREGYDVADVEYTAYAGETTTERGALEDDSATTANVRLMDPNLLSQTFGQLEQFRPYYSFPDTLHVDRYEIDGEIRDTVLAAREINPPGDDSWVNQHVIYTHGYGIVAADASEVGGGGRPSFLLSGIPTSGPLASEEDYEPRIYFGRNAPEYSVVGKEEDQPDRERDRPQETGSEQDTTYTFSEEGGPSIGGLFNRMAYAIKFGSTELFLSQDVNSQSQILFDRDPVERVEKVAPYLSVDTNTYPAIVDGRVKWIVDGYTTSDGFPYSDQSQLESATVDALNVDQNLLMSGQINYIRNSVKATVDAYDGSVTLYAWEPEDPLLQAWMNAYDSTVLPYSEMSAELMDHVRYPEDMFKVQREQLARYHVDDPGDFYEANDAWSVPDDPTAGAESNVKMPPYYMTMQMPGQDQPHFQLTTPFIPQEREGVAQRNVLYGFLGANGDAGTGEDGEKADTYGHLQMLELPRQTTTPGPGQAQNNFNSDNTVSQELNLLRQGASDVINGNMITLPVANGILYVQPVYVRSTGETSYPVLRKVLVAFGDEVGFADTLSESLDQVFEGESGAETPEEQQGEEPAEGEEDTGDAVPPMADSPEEQLTQALDDARDAMARSESAMADGDWAAYGQAQADLQDALDRALTLEDGEDPAAEDPAAEDPATDGNGDAANNGAEPEGD